MAIEDYKITAEEINEKHVEAQPDELTGTPDENKSVFDTLVEFVIGKLNGLIDFLVGNYISADQISDGLSTDVDNNVKWKYELVKGSSQGINFSGTVNYNTKTIIKSSPLPFLTLRNAIVKIGDTEYLMDNGVFATESYAEYDGKFRLSSDATNTYITILDQAFSTAIGTYLTIEVYSTSATTVPAKSLPLLVGEATGDYLQEQIDGINTSVGDMALSTVATDLTGAINETHNVVADWVDKTQSMIVIGQSSSQNLSTTETTLILGGTRVMHGNKLTRSGNGVLIGSGVNYVEVSGQMYINAGLSTGDTLTLSAARDSGGATSKISSLNTKCSGVMLGMALSPVMFSVSEGDIIYLQACNVTSARGTVPTYPTHTFLTVKVIA